MTYERYSLTLDIDDQLFGDLPSEEIVEHPSGIFLDHQQDRGCSEVGRRVANFEGFLQTRRVFKIVPSTSRDNARRYLIWQ